MSAVYALPRNEIPPTIRAALRTCLLVRGPPKHFDDAKRLLLAAEILSPTTARADRVVKRTLYRDENVPTYWIIDLDARAVERSSPNDPRSEILVDHLDWMPEGASEPLVIDLAAYFRAVLDG